MFTFSVQCPSCNQHIQRMKHFDNYTCCPHCEISLLKTKGLQHSISQWSKKKCLKVSSILSLIAFIPLVLYLFPSTYTLSTFMTWFFIGLGALVFLYILYVAMNKSFFTTREYTAGVDTYAELVHMPFFQNHKNIQCLSCKSLQMVDSARQYRHYHFMNDTPIPNKIRIDTIIQEHKRFYGCLRCSAQFTLKKESKQELIHRIVLPIILWILFIANSKFTNSTFLENIYMWLDFPKSELTFILFKCMYGYIFFFLFFYICTSTQKYFLQSRLQPINKLQK